MVDWKARGRGRYYLEALGTGIPPAAVAFDVGLVGLGVQAFLGEGEHAVADLCVFHGQCLWFEAMQFMLQFLDPERLTSSTCACETVGLNSKSTMCTIGILTVLLALISSSALASQSQPPDSL